MFGFGKKEAPQPQQQEEIKETGDQTIEKALNDPGFTEFLGKYSDRIELSDENAEEVKSRYERYQQVGKTIKEVQGVLAKEFSNEISTDALKISINPSEIDGARDYLEDMAVNNEGEFDRILETIQEYHATSQAADEAIEDVKQRFEELEKKQNTLNDVKEVSGFKRWVRLGMNEREQQAIADAKELKLNIRHPQDSQKRLDREGDLANRQVEWDVIDKLEKFDQVRMELMISLGENTGALKLAQDKIAQKLTESIGTSLADVDKASAAYNQMESDYYQSDLTFDYLNSNPDFDRVDYRNKLNKEAESRATEAIKNAVTLSPVINGQMSKLESTLDHYIKRESLGTKSQDETKDFVLGVVHELFAEYAKAHQEPSKKNKSWLLQRILEKNGVKADMNFKSEKQKQEEAQVAADAQEKKETNEAVANPENWQDYASETDEEEAPEEKRENNEHGSDKELTESINNEGTAIPNSPDTVDDAPPINETQLNENTMAPEKPFQAEQVVEEPPVKQKSETSPKDDSVLSQEEIDELIKAGLPKAENVPAQEATKEADNSPSFTSTAEAVRNNNEPADDLRNSHPSGNPSGSGEAVNQAFIANWQEATAEPIKQNGQKIDDQGRPLDSNGIPQL